MFIRTERSVKEFIQFYPVVSIIVIINLALWLFIDVLQLNFAMDFYKWGIGHNFAVYHGEYWRLFTPIFLHAGFAHVAFNSFSLVLFAPALEQMLGKIRFIFAYLTTGIVGNLGTYIIDPTSNTFHLGASGAVYGIFGIYIYMVLFRKDLIDQVNSQIIKTIFVIGLLMTFITPNINIPAHIFGFIGGFALSPLLLINVRPFSMARNRPIVRESSQSVQFDPNRWNKKRFLTRKTKKNIFWAIFGLLVLLGIMSRLLSW